MFQVYVWKDRELMRDVLASAREAGFTSIGVDRLDAVEPLVRMWSRWVQRTAEAFSLDRSGGARRAEMDG